jgi:hypothetical protein
MRARNSAGIAGRADDKSMIEGALCGLTVWVGARTHGSNLHMNNGLVTIAALRCGDETDGEPRFDLGEHALERDRWEMMTFVNDYLPTLGDALVTSGRAVDRPALVVDQ